MPVQLLLLQQEYARAVSHLHCHPKLEMPRAPDYITFLTSQLPGCLCSECPGI